MGGGGGEDKRAEIASLEGLQSGGGGKEGHHCHQVTLSSLGSNSHGYLRESKGHLLPESVSPGQHLAYWTKILAIYPTLL